MPQVSHPKSFGKPSVPKKSIMVFASLHGTALAGINLQSAVQSQADYSTMLCPGGVIIE